MIFTTTLPVMLTLMIFIPLRSLVFADTISSVQSATDSIVTVRGIYPSGNSENNNASHSEGAGVIVDSEGCIVSNLHTILLADRVLVSGKDGQLRRARIVNVLPEYDLAILKLKRQRGLPALRYADTSQLRPGQTVFHIGHSPLRARTISSARITNIAVHQANREPAMLRLNLEIYKGDSGGPIINQQGELVGIIRGQDRELPNISFAIPANKIKKIHRSSCGEDIIR